MNLFNKLVLNRLIIFLILIIKKYKVIIKYDR